MQPDILHDLGDGLILRRATLDDAEALAAFYVMVFSATGEPAEPLAVWTRDLMRHPHPTTSPGDFTIVEDTHSGQIVSALCLIGQTWAYEGIPFGVGRPELVATHPDYRRRGLVRAQMEVVHGWSAERGQVAQVITGIPWYYRQFGYDMALNLAGGRAGYAPQVPHLPAGASEPYHIRPATDADLPFLVEQYAQAQQRYPLTCLRDADIWRYELTGHSPVGQLKVEVRIIETAEGEAVGYLVHPWWLSGGMLAATQYEVKPGVSWLAVTPGVIRYLWTMCQDYATRDGVEAQAFGFWLGAEHPVYQAALSRLPRSQPPYAYYMRVADLHAFLRLIAPALEARLARSVAAGHSGQLHVSFFRGGLRLRLEQGRLVEIEDWRPSVSDGGHAAFPDLTFLQLLFGYRSLDELRAAYADCRVSGDEARALLEVLFPKRVSDVWALS